MINMPSDIDLVFESLYDDIVLYAENSQKTLLHSVSSAIVEQWANEIITLIIDNQLKPLKDSTIRRRASRNDNVLGPDYPLLETGEWITYIEFKLFQSDDSDKIQVGVWDESTRIGHDDQVTPAYIADINEYGYSDIPSRHLFTNSEVKIDTKIDEIITNSWNKIIHTNIIPIDIMPENLTGKIVSDGANFKFEWDK